MADTPLVGVSSVEDLRAFRFASAASVGLDTINDILNRELAALNNSMTDGLRLLADPLTEQQRIYGTSYRRAMQEVDEHGVPDSKKAQPGQTVGFPLRRFAVTLGWTRDALKRKTPAELAEDFISVRSGYNYEVIKQIKKAAYLKTNFTFVDELTNGVSLGVKRFLNADGAKIPDAPNGTSFTGATHTHYNAMTGSAVANVDINTLVDHVTEHGHNNGLLLAVAESDAPTISALSNFKNALDAGLITPSPTTQTFGAVAAPQLGDNRLIGFWRNSAVAVWIKPWAVAGRYACFGTGSGEKPLGYRQPAFAGLQGLRFNSIDERLTILAQLIEAEFGFGVWDRTAGAFLDVVNQATWSDPTIS